MNLGIFGLFGLSSFRLGLLVRCAFDVYGWLRWCCCVEICCDGILKPSFFVRGILGRGVRILNLKQGGWYGMIRRTYRWITQLLSFVFLVAVFMS